MPWTAELPAGDMTAFRWLIAGYENGFISLLSHEPGTCSRRVAVAVVEHLAKQGVRRPSVVLTPRASREQWRSLLLAVGLRFVEVETVAELEEARETAMVTLVSDLAAEAADIVERVKLHLWALAVIDECCLSEEELGRSLAVASLSPFRSVNYYRVGGVGAAPDREDSPTVFVRLMRRPLPATLPDLEVAFGCGSLGAGLVSAQRLDAILTRYSYGDAELVHWATEAFLVPRLQALLCSASFMRRLA
jgi:hypothetical protein